MRSIVFKIKTVTPTFMGGGDGRFDGIRASEIKGIMRWWFRALTGVGVGDNLNELKGIEGSIFGLAESKSNSCRSKFKITVESLNLEFIETNKQFPSNGFTYLGIGNVIFKYDRFSHQFFQNPDKSNQDGQVLIDAQSTFDLRLCFYPQANEDDINLIAGSLYIGTALGGFGLRARKCFGSWQIIEYKGFNLKFNPKDYTEDGIRTNIDKLKAIMSEKVKTHTPANKYPAIDDSHFVFNVIQTNEKNYQNLLDEFGRLYRGFRVCADNPQPSLPRRGIHTADFDFLRNVMSARNFKEANFSNYKVRNALFGLNIVYPQLRKNLQLERSKDDKNEVLRRASPVWFTVKEVDGKLNLHITLFKSLFKPEGSSVKFDGREVEIENYSLIEQRFIPYIKQELEVKK